MAESVYKVIELVGTSTKSWEKAAAAAIERASKSLRDLRIAEVAKLDMQIADGKVEAYRARVKVSFKYEGETERRRWMTDWRPADSSSKGWGGGTSPACPFQAGFSRPEKTYFLQVRRAARSNWDGR